MSENSGGRSRQSSIRAEVSSGLSDLSRRFSFKRRPKSIVLLASTAMPYDEYYRTCPADHKELGLRFQATIQSIREMDRNITELMRNRSMDEEPNRIEVVTHVYDASRAPGDEDLQEEVAEEEEEEFDPLKAFLPQGYSYAEQGPLSLKDAEKVKQECLKNLKSMGVPSWILTVKIPNI